MEQADAAVHGMIDGLDVFKLNAPHCLRRADNKQLQLKIAREVGLEIPRTVITNEPEAVRELEPFCGGFLYTHVDTEGLMQGIDMDAVRAVRAATAKSLTAAGGIRTREEILALDALGIDAVVGMAIYTGSLALD